MVSHHIHFEHMQPYESMEYLYCGSNIFFDPKIVDTFISTITLYPLGALVRLTTDEVGIIDITVVHDQLLRYTSIVLINHFQNRLKLTWEKSVLSLSRRY